jgi:hypothetical protein
MFFHPFLSYIIASLFLVTLFFSFDFPVNESPAWPQRWPKRGKSFEKETSEVIIRL